MPLRLPAHRLGVLAAFVLATCSLSENARADGKAACIAAFEEAGELRAARKLLDARRRLAECGSVRCPADVQKECAKDLDTLDASVPSVVMVARDQTGRDLIRGRVMLDGVGRELDGMAVPLDPGRHRFRFEVEGCEAVEQEALLAEGDKNRQIIGVVRCIAAAAAHEPSTSSEERSPASERPSPPSDQRSRPSSTSLVLPLLLGGVGVVGLAGFTYLGLDGRADLKSIKATGCAPTCDRDKVEAVRTRLVVGDIFGAVGLVSIGVAAWMFFTAGPPETRATTTLDVRPAVAGGTLVVSGGF